MKRRLQIKGFRGSFVWRNRLCVAGLSVFLFSMGAAAYGQGPIVAGPPDPVTGERTFVINTPGGPASITVGHLGMAEPADLGPAEAPVFRPPSIFSAPLPTGSGARALGFSGAFSAIADDATSASWNPAGLLNLERPEASAVLRYSQTRNQHQSSDEDFQVGDNDYESFGVNYLSLALPLPLLSRWNAVASLNYQEAYDFTQHFTAKSFSGSSDTFSQTNEKIFRETQVDNFIFEGGRFDISIVSEFTTESSSTLKQQIDTEVESYLDFEQEGIIEAFTPAFAVALLPNLFLGGAFNYYQDSAQPGKSIRSRSTTRYTATTRSRSELTNFQRTAGTYTQSGTFNSPGIPPFIPPFSTNLTEETGTYEAFEDTTVTRRTEVQHTDGLVEEKNRFEELHGYNGTLGILWTINRFFVVGASVDLPWEADARQHKTIRREAKTYNEPRTRLLSETASTVSEKKDVTFHFPLFWTLGLVTRWTPNFYSSIDVAQTLWSDFAFEVKREGKINPFDGTPHGENPVDDTWTVKFGTEYLVVTRKSEIPLRVGLIYEQRPAIGDADEYLGFSFGSGFSIGQDEGKTIVDFAYSYLQASDVQTVIPEQEGLTTDTDLHQFFVSIIRHF